MKKGLLISSFFLLGFTSISFQLILIREMTSVFLGSELFISFFFFSWFVSVATGALVAQSFKKSRFLERLYILILYVALLILPASQVLLSRSVKFMLHINPGELIGLLSTFLITILLSSPFPILIGFIFPVASQIFSKTLSAEPSESKKAAGFVYFIESLGSMLGGALTATLFLRHFSHLTILGSLICANSVILVFLAQWLIDGKKTRIFSIILVLSFALFFLSSQGRLDIASNSLRFGESSGGELLESKDSIYQNLSLRKFNGQYNLFANGNFVSSFPDPYRTRTLAHFLLCLHQNPKRILFAAQGSEEMIGSMLKHNPSRIDLIQIDRMSLEMTRKYLPVEIQAALLDSRVNMIFQDPKEFFSKGLQKTAEKYDLIIILAPDPSTLNFNRFFTKNFFESAASLLSKDGIFITSVSTTPNYLYGEVGLYLGSVFKTIKSVFPNIFVLPGTVSYLVASEATANLTYDFAKLTDRYLKLGIDDPDFNPKLFSGYLENARIEETREFLEKQIENFEINLDSKPVTLKLNMEILSMISGKWLTHLLAFFSKIKLWHYLITLIFISFGRLFWVYSRKPSQKTFFEFNALTSIFSTGLTGFALGILLIYFYQASYGYIYERIGLLTAFFMLGLFLGSLAANKILVSIAARSCKPMFATEILIVFLAFSTPVILLNLSSQMFFMVLSMLYGLATGFQFPLANKIYFEESDLFAAASRINALDHLGSALGALFFGSIVFPNLGLANSCVVLACLKLVSASFWLFPGRTGKP
jgi:predicted membrane-bound spermidine synthase